MPRKARASVVGASDEDADEFQSLCERIAALEAHRLRDLMCALDMELHWHPELSVHRMSVLTPVSEAAINSWIRDLSSPTWELLCTLARGLHPRDPLGDPLAWLEAGREHLRSLIERRDQLAREHREAALATALRQELTTSSTAEAMLPAVADLPVAVLAELIEMLSSELARDHGAESKEKST